METAVIILATTGRILVGLVMLIAGIAKVKAGPQQFSRAILGYDLVTPGVAFLLSRTLPWLEVVTGVCLIIGLFCAAASLIAFALLLVFSAALTMSLYRGRKHDCGCFGLGTVKRVRWQMVYRNLLLMGALAMTYLITGGFVSAT